MLKRHDDGELVSAISRAMETLKCSLDKARDGDVGAAVEPECIEAWRTLEREDRAEFARYRHMFKTANRGIKVTRIDELIRAGSGADKQTADRLVEIGRERCEFFHNDNDEAFVTFHRKEHRECWLLYSAGFREWLAYEFYRDRGKAASDVAVNAALSTLAGQAKYEGAKKQVFVRVAKVDNSYWIDLCDEDWRAIQVNKSGWKLIEKPPVLFARSRSMLPLPSPATVGEFENLWKVVNIPSADRLMVTAWMIECFRPDTPYVVLELTGEQGSAKSSTQSFLRSLIDPNHANNRSVPKTVEDLYVMARNTHLVSLENISHLPANYQDALCVLSTGGGYASRTLYTNADETVIKLQKPITLNGISVSVTAQDLLDRTLHVDLPQIKSRFTVSELEQYFCESKAAIFSGLLNIFARSLAVLPSVRIQPEKLPRMADFTMLGEAVYRAHGKKEGEFLEAYADSRRNGIHRTLEASPVAVASMAFLDTRYDGFEGTVKNLFERVSDYKPHGEAWPRSPKGFADQLRRISPALRLIGINARINEKPGRNGYTCLLKRMT